MLTLLHDYASPASAVAVARIRRLGVPVALAPFEPVPLDAPIAVGIDVLAELQALAKPAAHEGVVLRRPPLLPSTARAHLVATTAPDAAAEAAWHEAAYRALWTHGRDLADAGVLLELAVGVGLDRSRVARLLTDAAALAYLRRQMAAWRSRGVGGVPVLRAEHTLIPGLLDERTWGELASWRS